MYNVALRTYRAGFLFFFFFSRDDLSSPDVIESGGPGDRMTHYTFLYTPRVLLPPWPPYVECINIIYGVYYAHAHAESSDGNNTICIHGGIGVRR